EWGGFEEDQIAYLARHDRSGQRRWIPRISSDAHDGRQSAILPEGKTVLAPILSTAKIAHRFSCWMKADKPVDVTVQLAEDSKSSRIGHGWTRVDMTLTPANTLMGGIRASITVPPAVTVLVDSISIHPDMAK